MDIQVLYDFREYLDKEIKAYENNQDLLTRIVIAMKGLINEESSNVRWWSTDKVEIHFPFNNGPELLTHGVLPETLNRIGKIAKLSHFYADGDGIHIIYQKKSVLLEDE